MKLTPLSLAAILLLIVILFPETRDLLYKLVIIVAVLYAARFVYKKLK